MRGFVLGVLVTLIAIFGGSYLYLKLGMFDVSAIPNPGKMERHMAFMSLDASVERRAPKGPNPVPLTDDVLDRRCQGVRRTLLNVSWQPEQQGHEFRTQAFASRPQSRPPSHGRS